MNFWPHCLLSALVAVCPPLHAAGFEWLDLPAGTQGPALKAAVWTPCQQPPRAQNIGQISFQATPGCPVHGKELPVVLMSHGSGGTLLGHHDTAAALADTGFVVAALNHPGDNALDPTRRGEFAALVRRPLDQRRLLDHLLTTWHAASHLNPKQVGFFGFSRGGYTGLVLAGARPDPSLRSRFCEPTAPIPMCQDPHPPELAPAQAHEPRIKAAVIVDPLNLFAAPGLHGVHIPMQLWSSALGGDGVQPEHVARLAQDLPQRPEQHVAPEAGHFVFLAPCTAAQARALPILCEDPPPVHRGRFHDHFNHEVLRFLTRHLSTPAT